MTRSAATRRNFPARALSPDAGVPLARRPYPRRRIRSPAAARARRTAAAAAGGGRRSGPTTPLLRWKFDDDDPGPDQPGHPSQEKARRKVHNAGGEDARPAAISARKLAAGIWHLQLPEVGGGGCVDGGRARVGFELNPGHLHVPYACDHNDRHKDTRDEFSGAIPVHTSGNVISHKLEDSTLLLNSRMERATKWDPGYSKVSDEVYRIYGHLKLLEDQQVTAVSVASSLQAELEHSRSRISELEDERRSSKKKLDNFLKKLAEEKAAWRSREHEKIRAVIDAMKDDLKRERKSRQQMEIVNSKLVNELAEVKLSAKRFLQDYEKERKARMLMEEVCDELAKEIAEDKAEVEELKRESVSMRDEVEEERKMLQMAEVWREERVQMKLIDAKLTLEDKYAQLSRLQADIEAFLSTRGAVTTNPDVPQIKQAELLKEAAEVVRAQEIKDFSYQPPPAAEDIFSVFEELQPREEVNEREIEQCYGYSPASRASRIQTSSPDVNGFLDKPAKRYANGLIQRNGHVDDDSGWETVSHVEEQGSSNSPEGSDPSVNGYYEESNASVSGTDWEKNGNNGRLSSEISEIYSSTTKLSRKKGSSIIRLWRSSSPNNVENYKKHLVEAANGRVSNGRISNATLSPARKSEVVGLSSPSVGQCSSPDSLNPRIARGIKGYIKWPQGTQKQSLKAKLMEARMDNQKVQIRHVLKQKI